MNRPNEPQPSQPVNRGPQNITFTASVTFVGDQEPMVVTRTTVDGGVADVPFILVMGDDARFHLSGVPNEASSFALFAQALMRLSLSLATRVLGAAKSAATPAPAPPPAG